MSFKNVFVDGPNDEEDDDTDDFKPTTKKFQTASRNQVFSSVFMIVKSLIQSLASCEVQKCVGFWFHCG